MSRAQELTLLARQLTAHRAYVLRRAVAETASLGLASLGSAIPGAARLAARLHPASPAAHAALARRATATGDGAAAARHDAVRQHLERNTQETSVLPTILRIFRHSGRGEAVADGLAPLRAALAAGGHREARTWIDAAPLGVAARVDGWLAIAAAARRADDSDAARGAAEEACTLDSGRIDAWLVLGAARLAALQLDAAATAYEMAVSLAPRNLEALLGLGDALRASDPDGARCAWGRAVELHPDVDAPICRLEELEGTGAEPEVLRVAFREIVGPLVARVGDELDLELDLEVRGGAGVALHILVPHGAGLTCEEDGRRPLAAGAHRKRLKVRVERPDAVNLGRPWRLHAVLVGGEQVARAHVEIAVPEAEAGEILLIITEDHELYDERERIPVSLAETTLVTKSQLAESIANRAGARWTHMVDVGSQSMMAWAADRAGSASPWRAAADASRDHLVDAVAGGNDLGLHFHAFHDPAMPGFCHDFDVERDEVTTDPAFLAASIDERGFWSRAFPALGDVDAPATRAWATWRGIGQLEALGRLGDPRYRVALFRAGSYDFGMDAAERARSISLLGSLGVLADSDVPKSRFHHRPVTRGTYPIVDALEHPAEAIVDMQMLEVRPEYNIEADFLCDVGVLNRYVDGRVRAAMKDGVIAPGIHIVCAMSHDKFINWRMGRQWDSLDENYGDWATIRDHLEHVAQRHAAVRRVTAREAVLAWYERYSPELVAWRDEEVAVLSSGREETETFRYAIRLLGRDIPATPERPRRVRVSLPAWAQGRILSAQIERDREAWASAATPGSLPALDFVVDSRDPQWELVVDVEAGLGVSLVDCEETLLRLRASERYRRASVELPSGLAPDGVTRRYRNVSFEAVGDGFEARIALADGEVCRGGGAR